MPCHFKTRAHVTLLPARPPPYRRRSHGCDWRSCFAAGISQADSSVHGLGRDHEADYEISDAINAPDAAGEAVANAFRAAMTPRAGTALIAFPKVVQSAATEASVPPLLPLPALGPAPGIMIRPSMCGFTISS